jgi:hypothetical protein
MPPLLLGNAAVGTSLVIGKNVVLLEHADQISFFFKMIYLLALVFSPRRIKTGPLVPRLPASASSV